MHGESESDHVIDLLKSIPLFKDLEDGDLWRLQDIVYERRYKKGESVFQENNPGSGMYIISKGTVAITVKIGEKEQELARLSKGVFFGELALLDSSPRSAGAIAIEESNLIAFFRPDLMDLLERAPKLGAHIIFKLNSLIASRIRGANENLQRKKKSVSVAVQDELVKESDDNFILKWVRRKQRRGDVGIMLKLPLFNELSPRAISSFKFKEFSERKGKTLQVKGSKDQNLFVVLEGTVTLYNDNNRKKVNCVLHGPCIFGSTSLLDPGKRMVSAVATTNVRGQIIQPKDLQRIMNRNPEAAAVFLLGLSADLSALLRGANARIKEVK